jgi:hypothetical protein
VVLTLVVLVYNLVNASIISMVLPIVLLLVVLTHYPRAPTASLRFMFRYVCGVVVLKFTFQLPIFCENMAVNHQSGIITTGQWCVRAYVRTYVAAARLWRLSFNDFVIGDSCVCLQHRWCCYTCAITLAFGITHRYMLFV